MLRLVRQSGIAASPPELALKVANCITCGQFAAPCPDCWPGTAQNAGNITLVDDLSERAEVCPTGANHWIGEKRTAGDLILDKLRRLAALGAPVIVRIPLIPGFNADVESLNAIAKFLLTLDGLRSVDLLPYHSMGKAKYESLDRSYPWDGQDRLEDAQTGSLVDLFNSHRFQVRVGG